MAGERHMAEENEIDKFTARLSLVNIALAAVGELRRTRERDFADDENYLEGSLRELEQARRDYSNIIEQQQH